MTSRHAAGLAALLLTLASATPVGAQSSESVNAEARSFLRFVEDPAIIPAFWLEGFGRYQINESPFGDSEAEESNVAVLEPVIAFNVAEDFEFGARIGYANRDRDEGGSESGWTDMDIWGKLLVVTDPMKVSVGVLIKLPTGDEDDFLGTGETDVEFFGGIRKDLERFSFTGHGAVRVNQDPDYENVDLEGKNSWLLGAGVNFAATKNLALQVEWSFESERLEDAEEDSRIVGGFYYRLGQTVKIRAGAGFGLSDGAPDTQYLAGVALSF